MQKKRQREDDNKNNLDFEVKKAKLTDSEVPKLVQPPKKETKVVRLKRENGRITQNCDLYIGRRWKMGGWDLPQSKWANPFTIKKSGSADKAISSYREYLLSRKDLMNSLHELEGKTLGCWCKPAPCHGDVLVELVKQFQTKKADKLTLEEKGKVSDKKMTNKGEVKAEQKEEKKEGKKTKEDVKEVVKQLLKKESI